MPREVKIEIRREIKPSPLDYLLGTVWHWNVTQKEDLLTFWRYKSGFAYTEKQARRRAEKVARTILRGTIRYEYNPAGLTPGNSGK